MGLHKAQRYTSSADDEGPLPERIGRYTVQGTLGKGAFGVVYLGHDGDLDRHVGLKVPLSSRFSSPAELEAYVQEARTAAQLKHPGIVAVYDVQRETDRVVIIQEYIDGQDLSKAIESGPLPPEQAAELITLTRHRVGDRVGVGWIHSSIGTHDENLSPSFRATGRDAHGGYAEYMTVPEDYAYPVPQEFSDEQAAPLLCAGAIGYVHTKKALLAIARAVMNNDVGYADYNALRV